MNCFVCLKHQDNFNFPGGVIFQDELIFASHSLIPDGQSGAYLGYLIVEPKRHVEGLQNLNKVESDALGTLITRLSRALVNSENAEHVYLFVLGHNTPHLHYHLIPRYANTPLEWWGFRLDDWPEAARGGLREISLLCARLREYLSGDQFIG